MAQLSINRRESRTTASGAVLLLQFLHQQQQTNKRGVCINWGGREETVPRSWNDCASPRLLLLLLAASSAAITPKFHQNARPKKLTTKQRKTHNKLAYPKLHQCCQEEEEEEDEEKWQQTHNHHPPQNSDKNHRKNKDPPHTHTKLQHPSPPTCSQKKREKKKFTQKHKSNQNKKKGSKKTATIAAAAGAAESAKRNAGKVGKESGKQTQKKEGEAPYQQLPVRTVKQA
jgi:hypothetical protein